MFSYLVIPGKGNVHKMGRKDYMPFTDNDSTICGSDYIGFTTNAFQPSHLMQIEYEYFRNDHPYRRSKKFDGLIKHLLRILLLWTE